MPIHRSGWTGRIYTRGGDQGETSLAGVGGPKRVPKESARVEVYGTIDELNAALGLARALCPEAPEARLWGERLVALQRRLFAVGRDFAHVPAAGGETARHVSAGDVAELEGWIDELMPSVPRFRAFILQGGNPFAAALHLARTIARRAERRAWALARQEPVNEESLRYINRTSDFLFVLSRAANHALGVEEIPVEPEGGSGR